MNNPALSITDQEIYEGFKRMFTPSKSVKATRLKAGVLSHSHIVIFKKNDDIFIGKASGTKKYDFEIKLKRNAGYLLIAVPIDNIDASEIRNILVKLIKQQDKERESFERRNKENARRRANKEKERGLIIQPSKGFSVRLPNNVHNDYAIQKNESDNFFDAAEKCGYFHNKFIRFAKLHGVYCFFKSS